MFEMSVIFCKISKYLKENEENKLLQMWKNMFVCVSQISGIKYEIIHSLDKDIGQAIFPGLQFNFCSSTSR